MGERMKTLLKIMVPAVTILSLLQISIVSGTYVISYPNYVESNMPIKVGVGVLNMSQSQVNVTASVTSGGNVLGANTTSFSMNSFGLLSISPVPISAPNTNLTLVMNGTTGNGTLFSLTKQLKTDYRWPSIFIQTDKASYKAGQQVNLRIVSIYNNQQPYQGFMNITILDSKNRFMQEWTEVQSVMGMISKQFQLSSEPPTGDWTIKVTNNETTEIVKHFAVVAKVSQGFDVTVAAPPTYIALKKQSLSGNITVLDTNGKGVTGNAKITINVGYPYNLYSNPQFFMRYSDYSFIKQNVTVTKTFSVSGSVQFVFTSDEVERCLNTTILSLYVSNNTYITASLFITAVVTETVTGTTRNGTAFVILTPNAYKLQFNDYPRTFKPSLNHTTLLKVKRSDETQITTSDMKVPVVVVIQQYPSNHSQALNRVARSIDDLDIDIEIYEVLNRIKRSPTIDPYETTDYMSTASTTEKTTFIQTTEIPTTVSSSTIAATTEPSTATTDTRNTTIAGTTTTITINTTSDTSISSTTPTNPIVTTDAGISTTSVTASCQNTTLTTTTTTAITTNTIPAVGSMSYSSSTFSTSPNSHLSTYSSLAATASNASSQQSTAITTNTIPAVGSMSYSSSTFSTSPNSHLTTYSSLAATASNASSQQSTAITTNTIPAVGSMSYSSSTFSTSPNSHLTTYSSLAATASNVSSQTSTSLYPVSTSFPTSTPRLSFISSQRTGFTLTSTPATACDNLPAEVTCQIMTFSIPVDGNIDISFPVKANTTDVYIQANYQDVQAWQWFKNNIYSATAFIQIRKPPSTLMVGSPFDVVFDTTEQRGTYFYMIISSGHVVATGKVTSTTFTLTPENSWAPTSTLVVYYVNDRNEIISDTLVLPVQYMFNNKVVLSWSKQLALPSETVSLTITVNEPNSKVGLLIADSSALLLKNDFNAANVINALMGYNSTPFTDINNPFTSKYLNFSVQSDAVAPAFEDPFYDQYPIEEMGKAISLSQLIPTIFPDTWIWQDVSIEAGTTTTLNLTLPDTSTTWVASAFALSSTRGFGWTTDFAQIKTFQSFKMALNVPSTVTNGENVVIEVVVFNTQQTTLTVIVMLQKSAAFTPFGQSSANNAQSMYQISMPGQSSKSVFFPITPTQIGQIHIDIIGRSGGTELFKTGSIYVKAKGIPKLFSMSTLVSISSSSSQTKTLNYTFPSNIVPGSEQISVSVIGDMMGPSISGLDSLIQMPYGCGEQNMINFAPSVYAMQYLRNTDQVKPDVEARAMAAISTGYQRELTFFRNDYSFSAFGSYDYSGSTWLSAFVIKCFLQARSFITIDNSVLSMTISWLMKFQQATGEFIEPGRVIHSELKGGQNSAVTLTAFILIAITEQPVYVNSYPNNVTKAAQYLENQLQSIKDNTYSLSIVTYALALANSTMANEAYYLLSLKATQQGDLMYWTTTPVTLGYWYPPRSVDIEATAYSLLANMRLFGAANGTSIMKWLSLQRSSLGGFMSTQDTIIALQALSQFVAISKSLPASLNIRVSQPGVSSQPTFTITKDNMLQKQTQKLEVKNPLNISATCQGSGTVLVQVDISYTVTLPSGSRKRRDTSSTDIFNLNITVRDDPANMDHLDVEACTSLIPQGNTTETGMAIMEVTLPSGFVLSAAGVNQSDLIPKVENQNGKVNIYFYSINTTDICVSIPAVRQSNVANAQDAYISVYDYYDPSKITTKTYNSPVLTNIDPCQFCGVNCSLCKSNVDPTTLAPSTEMISVGSATETTVGIITVSSTVKSTTVKTVVGSASVHLPIGIIHILLGVLMTLR
ncbi:CD109 antigen-like isoform X2 [Protopterus annectens]|uniref:CD109 antigen-like isoform X2 n=1 Tax=Protopterus annectens TaxID=7888 RepID=UPI001CFA8A09|nr:CD109 antigen-like isoform X2 [Protopterus annectens]